MTVRLAFSAFASAAALAACAAETRINAIGERPREEIVAFFADNEFGKRPAAAEKPALLSFESDGADSLLECGGGLQIVRKRLRAAEQHVERVAVLWPDERLAV